MNETPATPPDSPDDWLRRALDPRRDVVVEACAGSGKTWLLVSRIVRLLLDGVAPGEILAITYTRKAAREIEQRLHDWLRFLATADDAAAADFLRQRAIVDERIDAALARARGLYESVLQARPALTISTFHGWYARLVQAAPLMSDLAGFRLIESSARLHDELWQRFVKRIASARDEAAESFLWLLQHLGLSATRQLFDEFAGRQIEWRAWGGRPPQPLSERLAWLRRDLGVAQEPQAVAAFFADTRRMAALADCAAILARSELQREQAQAVALAGALEDSDREAGFARIERVFLNQDGAPRSRKPSQAAEKRFGSGDARRLLDLHAELAQDVLQTVAQRCEEQVYALNRHAFTAAGAWLDFLAGHKADHRLMDFADLEGQVADLLAQEDQAAFLQARLDARYRHLLLDEFQDTNPLQWQILLNWLDAYAADDARRPRLFLVGDPKQSIYRFRRAEARVFDVAARHLEETHGACRLTQDQTRRNAPALIEVVNQVFGALDDFPHFRRHASLNADLPGRVELLPLCGREPPSAADRATPRNPLRTPRAALEDARRRDEAVGLVRRLGEIVGRWAVSDAHSGRPRPARYGDVLILARRRAALREVERALREAAIPYLGASRGGLLGTLEAADLTALLRALVTPADDLALAHALRTPLLGASDDDLLWLAEHQADQERHWWARLQAAAEAPECPQALARAARLLTAWQDAALRLPVHDLIDRLYHEGDLMARYRAAVPRALWPGVRANLQAYLALALQLDAGRYPSLPRFLDALAEWDRMGADDAPDEGLITHDERAADRVRLMTIHGAKGLEAPIVWLVDAHATHAPAEAWSLLIDWPPEADRPRHLSVRGHKQEEGERRRPWIEAEAGHARREALNLLYVALTRARQYFFASGIDSERHSSRVSDWQRLDAALSALGQTGAHHGEAPILPEAPPEPPRPLSPPVPQRTAAADCLAPAIGQRRPPDSPERIFGNRLHAVIERLAADPAVSEPPPGIPPREWPALRERAREMLSHIAGQSFFDPSDCLRALDEVEFVLADGQTGRIDRLLETKQGFWIIDYKSRLTNAPQLADYRIQMQRYRLAVGELFPGRPVRCLLVGAGGDVLEV